MPEAKKNSSAVIPFPYRGVFVKIIHKTVGFGGTKRKEKTKAFYLVERDAEGKTFTRKLGTDYLPHGKPKPIEVEELLKDFIPEPQIYMERVAPKLGEMERLVDEGDLHRENEEMLSAEFAYGSALEMDDYHMRANFGIGITYLQMGNQKKAAGIFEKLISVETSLSPEHKHLFNEFGITLRKNKMYAECLEYYGRAEKLARNDEHLLFNVARVYFDMGQFQLASNYTMRALEANPDFTEARKLKMALAQKDDGGGAKYNMDMSG